MSLRLGCVWLALIMVACVACEPDQQSKSGKACTSDDDCGSLACLADDGAAAVDLTPLPLLCGKPADAKSPGEACEKASDCDLHMCLLAGACARPCATDDQCTQLERCQAVFARTGKTALQSAHACVAMVDLPKGVQVKVEDRLGALHGRIDDLKLTAAADLTLFVLEHLSDHRWPIPKPTSICRPPLCTQKLVANDATHTVLFDYQALGQSADGPKNPVANGDHVNPLTVLVPNGPRSPRPQTSYTLSAKSDVAGDLRVTTLHGTSQGHRLDLNVYYLGVQDFSASGSRGPMLLADALAVVDRILGQAGIFVGDVRQIDVRGKLLSEGVPLKGAEVSQGFSPISAQIGVYPELPELFKLSAGAGNSALDIFFVTDIEPISGGDVGAISGGTPGAWGMHGTAGSGIAVSTDMMVTENDPASLGRTLAHEIGHMLGLFHTVEVDGTVIDPLPDTPACPIDHDTNGNGLDGAECVGFGGDNLMFPTTETGSEKLTAQQQAVLSSALLLQ